MVYISKDCSIAAVRVEICCIRLNSLTSWIDEFRTYAFQEFNLAQTF